MLYLASEIVLSLFAAAVLGVGVGWFLRAARRSTSDRAQLEVANSDVARLEERLREVGPEAMLLQPRLAELETRYAELESMLEISRRDGAALRAELAAQLVENERLQGAVDEATNLAAAQSVQEEQTEDRERAERLHAAEAQVADLRNEVFSHEARLAAMREQMAKLRGDAQQASDQVATERESHRRTLDKLEALESLHADCDFAFSALRDQILLLRARVAELERRAVTPIRPDVLDDEDEEPQLGNGTSGR